MSAEVDWAGIAYFEEQEREEQSEEAFFESMRVKIDDLVKEYTPQQANALSPMQLMTQMNEALSKATDFFGKVINIKGIYQQGNGVSYNGYYYDKLKDENSVTQVEILVLETIRAKMKPNSLVIVSGMITKRIEGMKSTVRLLFRVDSIVEEVKAQVIDKDDQRRIELRQRKVAMGFKNVDSILESMLLKGERPKIALLLAESSITLRDFESGKRAASVEIDFVEDRVTFTQTSQLCAKLRYLDQQGYTAIALVRGGGIDSKTDVDKPEVIETVVGMKTPFISGLGHEPEIIFLRQVADKWTPTPTGLGQYFSEIVEKASEKRTNSRAVLEEKFKKEIEESKNKNKDLMKQVEQMQENQKKQAETLKTQTDNLTKLQTTNNELNKSVQQLTVKHSLAEKEREIEKEKVKQLNDEIKESNRRKILVYIIIAVLALIVGFVTARLMFPYSY